MSGNNLIRYLLGAIVVVMAAVGCTEFATDVTPGTAPLKILSGQHDFGKNGFDKLLFLSKSSTGYVFGGTIGEPHFSHLTVVHLDEGGNVASTLNNWLFVLEYPDTIIRRYSVGYLGNDVATLLSLPNYLPFANQTVAADADMVLDVDIMFGSGRRQMAHRFVVPDNAAHDLPKGDYQYKDYVEVPFEVYDDHGRQLMVSFRDQGQDGTFNIVKSNLNNPPDESSSLEYIFIHDLNYDEESPDPSLSTVSLEFSPALWICPVLDGSYPGPWEPATVPYATLQIRRFEGPLTSLTDDVLEAALQEDTEEYMVLVGGRLNSDLAGYAISLVSLSKDLDIKKANLVAILPDVSDLETASMWPTGDGGAVAMTTYQQDSLWTTTIKVDASNLVEFRGGKSLSVTEFIENGGDYFLTSGHDIFQFGSQGIGDPINSTVYFGQMAVEPVNNGFVALFLSGGGHPELHLFNQAFESIGYQVFKPMQELSQDAGYSLYYDPSRVELQSMGTQLFFAGASGAFYDYSPGTPNLYVGRLDMATGLDAFTPLDYKIHNLGLPVMQNKAYFNDDGSAAHIVVLQSTETTTDVLFLKTGADFKLAKD